MNSTAPNLTRQLLLVFLIMSVVSCATDNEDASQEFIDLVRGEGSVSLDGWSRVRGEIVLYADKDAMKSKARYPRCISGVFRERQNYSKALGQFDGKRVRVSGVLIDYASLKDEDEFALRKVLAGSIISNWCFGDRVLLLNRISIR